MTTKNFITGFVLIRNNRVIADGRLLFEKQNVSPVEFFNTAYLELGLNYPRFFKMDSLCKTGFLAAEILLRNKNLKTQYNAEQTGILFTNANSSLDTDILFHDSLAIAPSPSLFVYTLPNILAGEISIRHGIKGESACFVFDIFDPAFQVNYMNMLMDSGRIEAGISGWADFYGGKFDALFYLVERKSTGFSKEHTAENAAKLYNELWSN